MSAMGNGFPKLNSKLKLLIIRNYDRGFCTERPKNYVGNSKDISVNFPYLIDTCSDFFSLRKIHARILVFGFGDSIFLRSKLINCYAKFGFLESRWVFHRIIGNSLSLWKSVLIGYFRACYFDEVLLWYSDLKQRKIGLDGAAATLALKSCVEIRNFEFGRGLHADAIKFGLARNCFVGSTLVVLYRKLGNVDYAYRVFDEITEKDLVAYTSMITGFAQCRDHRAYEAFSVAQRMQKHHMCPNRVTLVSLLQSAAQLEALDEGRAIHGFAIRRGIGMADEIFETSLMDMYHKCGALKIATWVFRKTKARTIGAWNAIISAHLNWGQPLESFNLFSELMRRKIVPDLVTLSNAVLCCAKLSYLRLGKSIHGYTIRTEDRLDAVTETALVEFYSKFNLIQAKEVFNRSKIRDAILYDVMMAGYLLHDLNIEAHKTFCDMLETSSRPSLGSILNLLSAISNLKGITQARSAHAYIMRHGYDENVEISNQTICTYSRCGFVPYAEHVFNKMRVRDVVSWTSMMTCYVFHEHVDEAIALFRLMQMQGLNCDSVTLSCLLQVSNQSVCLSFVKEIHGQLYRAFLGNEKNIINSLITTYARFGRLDMARHLFQNMTNQCLTSWNAILAAYGMHGNCAQVLKLFDDMKTKHIRPDETSFTSILTTCSHSGLVEVGLKVFRTMVEEYSMVPCEIHCNCIVDLLSRAGRLEEAFNLVKYLPLRRKSSALGALLSACKLYGDTKMGEVIGRELLEMEPDSSSSYTSLSNTYAEVGKWDEAATIRAIVKDRSLKSIAGCSKIQLISSFTV